MLSFEHTSPMGVEVPCALTYRVIVRRELGIFDLRAHHAEAPSPFFSGLGDVNASPTCVADHLGEDWRGCLLAVFRATQSEFPRLAATNPCAAASHGGWHARGRHCASKELSMSESATPSE